jgi:hypothetical protein
MAVIEINWHPSRNELRVFAVMLIAFGGIAGGIVFARFQAFGVALALAGVFGLLGLAGLAFPRLLRGVYVVWMAAVYPIGWIVSHTLLACLYFLVVTPIGIIMRLLGRDPLNRRFERQTPSYWKQRSEEDSPRRYFRQF